MTTKTTYKVGDKVRVLNANAIMACEAKDGDILEVIDVETSVFPTLRDVDGEGLCILGSELKYIEKVAEQVAKFKVGDKVRIIAEGAAGLSIGTEAKVIEVDRDGDVYLDVNNVHGNKAFYLARNIELVTPKPTKNQRITTLEQTIADLQAEVEALKAAQKLPTMTVKADVDVAKIAESLAKAIEKHSPNEQRKAIIAEAKAFVEGALNRNYPINSTPTMKSISKSVWFTDKDGSYITVKCEFVVNAKKRTVVAIIRDAESNIVQHKAIAKCAPDDVFNADIGKAIALGRALGLDVSKFEKAVQPSEVVVGMHVRTRYMCGGYNDNCPTFVTRIHKGLPAFDNGSYSSHYGITNDTEAQY